ncbi:MAG: hypothetical protein NVS4B5_18770 [Vulcanimicrobiaceae bacterium]
MASIDLLRDDPGARAYAAGTVLFAPPDAAVCAYVVLVGEVELTRAGTHLDLASVGDIVGELALLGRSVHEETATARTDCTVVPVDQRRFLTLVQQAPYFTIEVMTAMARRSRRNPPTA